MKKLLRLLLVAAALSASTACVVRGRAVYTVDVSPPPPRGVVVVTPRAGQVWIEGNWQYVDGRWIWRDGYWVRERAGQVWIPGAWIQVGARWHWRAGRWERRDRHTPPPRPRDVDHRPPSRPPADQPPHRPPIVNPR